MSLFHPTTARASAKANGRAVADDGRVANGRSASRRAVTGTQRVATNEADRPRIAEEPRTGGNRDDRASGNRGGGELTNDNRASAAEMLGSSRQNLCVVLRCRRLGDLAMVEPG